MKQAGKQFAVAQVGGMDYEGRGVARVAGKTLFIRGALPLEQVAYRVVRSKKQFDEAETVAVLAASPQRVQPKCGYFDTCGGCALQHVEPLGQVAYKQRMVAEQLQRIGKVQPRQWLAPIYGWAWGYRQRARLSVAVDAAGRLKLGFQARQTHEVVDIAACPVLPAHVSALLPSLQSMLAQLAVAGMESLFVECSVGDAVTVLNIATRKRPSESALQILRQFADGLNGVGAPGWQIWLQHGQEAYPFYPLNAPVLQYRLPEFDITLPYRSGDFTQINADTNALMVARSLRLLDVQPGDRVADLFCGLGNFSLPMAKKGAQVLGIEGADYLVRRARDNARLNGCETNVRFQTADLFEAHPGTVAAWGQLDKMLLDPPRSGAYAVVQALHEPYLPQRIVYVSCNPATFARDAAVLVEKDYDFMAAGIMNMFAQTAHVETIGWFEKSRSRQAAGGEV